MVPPNPQIRSMVFWDNTGVNLPMTKHTKALSITVDGKLNWTANRNPAGGRYDARGFIGHPAHYQAGYKCAGMNEGCLVVKIAKEGVMLIFTFDSTNLIVEDGKFRLELDVPADISGNIEMGINDNGAIGDNDGIMNVLDISWKERPR